MQNNEEDQPPNNNNNSSNNDTTTLPPIVVPDLIVSATLTLEQLFTGCEIKKPITRQVQVRDRNFSLVDTVTIKVPPGTAAPGSLRLFGLGHVINNEEKKEELRGDLLVMIKQQPHARFTRTGNDLNCTIVCNNKYCYLCIIFVITNTYFY